MTSSWIVLAFAFALVAAAAGVLYVGARGAPRDRGSAGDPPRDADGSAGTPEDDGT